MKRSFIINFGQSTDHSIDYLQGILKDARVTTLLLAQKLTNDELHWQYKPGWNTVGALLSHIAAIEHYFRIEFIESRKLSDEENEIWLPGLEMGQYLPLLINNQPLESYITSLTESREMLLGALSEVTFEDFTKRIDDYDPDTGTNLAWALYHMVEDEIYHRGQISIIRKLYNEHLPLQSVNE